MLPRAAPALLALALLLPVLPVEGDGDAVPLVPCTDPRGCPDLVLDKAKVLMQLQRTESFPATHCDVQEGLTQPGERQVLRFTYNTPNVGAGALRLGAPAQHPEWFVWAPCHGHWHMREYADYRVWTVEGWLAWEQLRLASPDATAAEVLAAHPELQDDFVAGAKQGYCVIDLYPALPTGGAVVVPDPRTFTSCASNQGLSPGWADEYWVFTVGQYVDVTGLPSGPYLLEVEVNAERMYQESDYQNNRWSVPVAIAEAL